MVDGGAGRARGRGMRSCATPRCRLLGCTPRSHSSAHPYAALHCSSCTAGHVRSKVAMYGAVQPACARELPPRRRITPCALPSCLRPPWFSSCPCLQGRREGEGGVADSQRREEYGTRGDDPFKIWRFSKSLPAGNCSSVVC